MLEERYRSALRWLPASYRAEWEEDMVATFLDSMHTDDPEEAEHLAWCGRPSRAERASIAALAVRLRLGGVEAPPRAFAWGQAVRLVALVGLLAHAAVATAGVCQELWIAGRLPWPPVPDAILGIGEGRMPASGSVAWALAPLLWVAAYLALVLGGRRAARVLAGLALVPAAVAALASTASAAAGLGPIVLVALTVWPPVVADAVPVLALAAFHRDAPRLRPRPWLAAYAAGLALALVTAAAVLLQAVRNVVLLDWPGAWSVVLVAAGVAYLARPAAERARRAPAWPLALALLGAVVLALRATSLLAYALAGTAGAHPALLTTVVVQVLAVAGVTVALAALAARTLHALPPAAGTAVDRTA